MSVRVGGLDHSTWDLVVRVPDGTAAEVLASHGVIAEEAQLVHDLVPGLTEELGKHGELHWSPGGAVSNTLAGMACRQGLGRWDVELFWLGVTAPPNVAAEPTVGPLDALRRLGIVPFSLARASRHARRLQLVDEAAGVAMMSDRPRLAPEPRPVSWPALDVLIISTTELVTADSRLWHSITRVPAIAVLAEDDAECHDRLLDLARAGLLRWLFGSLRQLVVTGLVMDGAPARDLRGVELVATDVAAGRVTIWTPATSAPRHFDVDGRSRPGGNRLGVADAYAGAYLYGRLLGNELEDAHTAAAMLAQEVGEVCGARPPPERDLNRIFSEQIGRSSDEHEEGWLFDRVRTAAGLVVVSGGQTGVDQLALQAASLLGLPAFCVLPAGGRTETSEGLLPGPDRFGDAHITTLGSPSYRYRTWTTVYVADGTLIWDYHASEGCATARDACRALGRPFLDVVPLAAEQRRERVWEFIANHDLRVINVEGNRGTLLTDAETRSAHAQLLELLRIVAARGRRRDATVAVPKLGRRRGAGAALRHARRRNRPLAIGLPTVPAQGELFGQFLREAHGLNPPPARSMVTSYQDPPLEVVLARPRDLPPLLHAGAVELVLCGSDLLDPAAGDAILLDTGLSPLLLVLVGHDTTRRGALAEQLVAGRVGSQDRPLASRLLHEAAGYRGGVREIHGTAETWIRRSILDVAVDTWSTGATVEANGLELLHVFCETSLVLAARFADAAHNPDVWGFVDLFTAWLTGDTPRTEVLHA
jgi:sugar/nucleoside kinase (ribokinase family)